MPREGQVQSAYVATEAVAKESDAFPIVGTETIQIPHLKSQDSFPFLGCRSHVFDCAVLGDAEQVLSGASIHKQFFLS